MRAFLAALCLILEPLAAVANVVVILADDFGRESCSAYPGNVADFPQTNLNALASNGIRFDRAISEPSCSPSRAALLTGRAPYHTGVGSPNTPFTIGLNAAESTIPKILQAAGVRTEMCGKWHLAGTSLGAAAFVHPLAAGFGHWHGMLYNMSAGNYTTYQWIDDGVVATGNQYATQRTTDCALAAIAGSEPYFLWLAYNAPHAPFHCPNAVVSGIAPHYDSTCSPGTIPTLAESMADAMDSELGRLFASPNWSWSDTTVIFLGDNGRVTTVVEAPFNPSHAKGTVYAQGVGVPLLVRGAAVAPSEQGTVGTQSIHITDLSALILDLFGLWPNETVVGGISIKPYLAESSTPSLRAVAFAEGFDINGLPYNPSSGLERVAESGTFRLLKHADGSVEMFDVSTDPYEAACLCGNTASACNTGGYSACPTGLGATALAAYDAMLPTVTLPESAPESHSGRRHGQ